MGRRPFLPHQIRPVNHQGRTVCRYRGRMFTFGPWDLNSDAPTPEALAAFQRQVGLWAVNPEAGMHATSRGEPLMEVWADWLESPHAPRDRKGENGRCGRELFGTPDAPGPLAGASSSDLTGADVLAWQDSLCRRKLSGYTVRRYVSLLRRCLSWGRVAGRVPGSVTESVNLVPKPPADSVKPPKVRGTVSEGEVNDVTGRLASAVADLLRVMWLCGARPSELCDLLVGMIVRSGTLRSQLKAEVSVDLDAFGVWAAVLTEHKTLRHGKERVLFFGPKAQAILAVILADKRPGEPVFAKAGGGAYTSKQIRDYVKKACKSAGRPVWTPYMIDHAFMARVMVAFSGETPGLGVLAAKAARGHSLRGVTEQYTGADLVTAAKVAAKVG